MQIEEIGALIAKFQQTGPDFMNQCCIINGAIWPLESIEHMGLDEYASRSVYSLPLRLYKYYPDRESEIEENGNKTKVNYSFEALKANKVYLSRPDLFDDPFDSELSVSWEEFEKHRIISYANWGGIVVQDGIPCEKAADQLLTHLNETAQSGESLESIFDLKQLGDYTQLLIKLFVLRLQKHLIATKDWAVALKETLWEEYQEYIKDLQRQFCIACFTTTPFSQLMWGHYANEHKGFCLEYTLDQEDVNQELWANLRPVIYCKHRYPITQVLLDSQNQNHTKESMRDVYLNGALRKSFDWAYQNEWRLLLPPQKHHQKGFQKDFFPITKVFLGNRMSATRRKEIIDFCKSKDIPYAGMLRSPDIYEMKECGSLCDQCPRIDGC